MPSWSVIHKRLCELAKDRGVYDVEEARWILAGLKARVHEPLGYGSYLEYLDRILGYSPRVAAERIRVAKALADLPALGQAVRRSELSWSAAREISRVATLDTVDAWIETCRGETVRDVERQVAGRRPGDLPTAPPDERARTHVVRFEVDGDTLALLREARSRLTANAGEHVTDDRLVRLLSRAVLDESADEGRAGYQLALHVCARCGSGQAEGGGEVVPVHDAVVDAARRDAQVVTIDPRAGAHVGDPPATAPAQRPRATQTIPPAIRREVVRRHRGRCAVPGCRHHAFLHQHHRIRRADGGRHDPDQMLLLCEAHHRAVHEGYLVIDGSHSEGFRFHHADGAAYGTKAPARSPVRLRRLAAAVQALRETGLPEHEAGLRVLQAHAHVGATAPIDHLVHAALTSHRRPPVDGTAPLRNSTSHAPVAQPDRAAAF